MEIPATDTQRIANIIAFGHVGIPIYDAIPATYQGAELIAIRTGAPPTISYAYYFWDGAAFVATGGSHAAVTFAAAPDKIGDLLGLSGQELSLDSQNANLVFAGPTTGAAADPTFRALVADDAPHAILSTWHSDTLAAAVVDGDIIIGNVTPKWSRLAVSIPAANVLNVLGVANGELRPSWKTLFDNTNPAAIGVAAPGTSLIAAHRDHVHGTGAAVLTTDANWIDLTDGGATALHTHAGGSGHTIRENGVDQTARTGLNFVDADAGAGLIVDDAGNNETEVHLDLYVLLGVGRAGGSTIYGGNAANESLILGGTSHGTHATSTILCRDHIEMSSGKSIQDSSHNARITVSTATPFVTLTGDTQITTTLGIGVAPSSTGLTLLLANPAVTLTGAAQTYRAADFGVNISTGAFNNQFVEGLHAQNVQLTVSSGTTGHQVLGLSFVVVASTGGGGATVTQMIGVYTRIGATSFTGTITNSYGIKVDSASVAFGTPSFSNHYQLYLEKGNSNKIVNFFGLRIVDETVATGTIYLAEIGPATPYFRIKGNFAAAANATAIYISEGAGPTLRQLKTFDPGAAGVNFTAGQLVCVLV